MSDFLDNIAIRALGGARGIRPRTLPMFAEPDLSGSRDLDTALEAFEVMGDTSHRQVATDFETSTDLEYAARDTRPQLSGTEFGTSSDFDHAERNTGQPQSHRPEIAETHGLEARHHSPPERPASRDHIERTVLRDDSNGARGSAPQSAHGEEGDATLQTVQRSELQRPNSEANLFPLESTLSRRDVEMSSHAFAERPTATARQEANPVSAASRHSVKPPLPRAAEARVQSRGLPADRETPVSEQFDFIPDLVDHHTSSPANVARLQASELPSAFMENESNSPAQQPWRPTFSPMIGSARTRNQQRLRQATGQVTSSAEPDIHITIGRVDVRAIVTSPAQEKKDRSSAPLQLADYLKRRDGSGAA